MIHTKLATTPSELEQIRALMLANMKQNLENLDQGFLSVEYSMQDLIQFNETTPAIIAVAPSGSDASSSVVVGYALAADMHAALAHHLLKEATQEVYDRCSFNGKPIRDSKFVVMGQVCVAKECRGQGVLQQLYSLFLSTYKERGYDLVETEVSKANERSLKAHVKTGWVVVDSLTVEGGEWHVIALDLKSSK
ncbi:hypothetical protein CcCBS67573_g04815 [Chytriomyces confervae]|uniref:N-acetyltransferase domain-containing protein n=1 Tax=Chytriomyces confervae TaxID=246404 RepID=A0A507FF49_9FUNG|nr:hypothetical protein CcCBS67573_g04815 [Chytriomyces confervae]